MKFLFLFNLILNYVMIIIGDNMKKYIKILLCFMFFVPCFVYGKMVNYEGAIFRANNYIINFHEYRDYIMTEKMKYDFEIVDGVGTIKRNDMFYTGGLLSRDEYIITNVRNNSYLVSGIEYWTLTPHSSRRNYILSYKLFSKGYEESSNLRVSQFTLNDVKIGGSGTKENPWYFLDIKRVDFFSNDGYKGKLSLTGCTENETFNTVSVLKNDGFDSDIYLCPNEHFEYYADKSSCDSFMYYSGDGNKYIISDKNTTEKIKDNTICRVEFVYQTTRVTLENGKVEGANPNVLYLANNKDYWFTDSLGYNRINKITIPVMKGYIFQGYYTEKENVHDLSGNENGEKIIDENGNIITTDFNGTVLYPHWKPIQFNVVFNSNGGSGSIETITCTYDQDCILPSATSVLSRSNHTFWGWTITAKNPVGGNPSVDYKDGVNVKNISFTQGENVNLYAMWRVNYHCRISGGELVVIDNVYYCKKGKESHRVCYYDWGACGFGDNWEYCEWCDDVKRCPSGFREYSGYCIKNADNS